MTDQPIVYVDTSEIRPGRLAELAAAMKDLVRFVRGHFPQLLAYEVYFSTDGAPGRRHRAGARGSRGFWRSHVADPR